MCELSRASCLFKCPSASLRHPVLSTAAPSKPHGRRNNKQQSSPFLQCQECMASKLAPSFASLLGKIKRNASQARGSPEPPPLLFIEVLLPSNAFTTQPSTPFTDKRSQGHELGIHSTTTSGSPDSGQQSGSRKRTPPGKSSSSSTHQGIEMTLFRYNYTGILARTHTQLHGLADLSWKRPPLLSPLLLPRQRRCPRPPGLDNGECLPPPRPCNHHHHHGFPRCCCCCCYFDVGTRQQERERKPYVCFGGGCVDGKRHAARRAGQV